MAKKKYTRTGVPDNLEGEALMLLHQARDGKKLSKPFTIEHGLAIQTFYRKLNDRDLVRGLCLEGNHP